MLRDDGGAPHGSRLNHRKTLTFRTPPAGVCPKRGYFATFFAASHTRQPHLAATGYRAPHAPRARWVPVSHHAQQRGSHIQCSPRSPFTGKFLPVTGHAAKQRSTRRRPRSFRGSYAGPWKGGRFVKRAKTEFAKGVLYSRIPPHSPIYNREKGG